MGPIWTTEELLCFAHLVLYVFHHKKQPTQITTVRMRRLVFFLLLLIFFFNTFFSAAPMLVITIHIYYYTMQINVHIFCCVLQKHQITQYTFMSVWEVLDKTRNISWPTQSHDCLRRKEPLEKKMMIFVLNNVFCCCFFLSGYGKRN